MPPTSDPFIGYLLFAGAPGAIAFLGWWLSGRFRALEQTQAKALILHEQDDQRRHEQNLGKFSEINERLARIGNGSSNNFLASDPERWK
jgi:hypothetical protein